MDELASMLNNPICIFDVSGQLDAFVKFFITVGFSPFDFSFDITIVEVTLLNMQDITDPICNHPPPPHLAQEDDAAGTLILKIGPNTPGRNVADGAGGRELQDNEKVVVRQLDNNAGDGHKFSVTAFGLTQEYPEEGHPLIKRIMADGGTKQGQHHHAARRRRERQPRRRSTRSRSTSPCRSRSAAAPTRT